MKIIIKKPLMSYRKKIIIKYHKNIIIIEIIENEVASISVTPTRNVNHDFSDQICPNCDDNLYICILIT